MRISKLLPIIFSALSSCFSSAYQFVFFSTRNLNSPLESSFRDRIYHAHVAFDDVSCNSKDEIKLRAAKLCDLPAVSHLCISIFRSRSPWWLFLYNIMQEMLLYRKLKERLLEIHTNNLMHKMVVACDDQQSVIGFMEIGMLPPPMKFISSNNSSMSAGVENKFTESSVGHIDSSYMYSVRPPDVPYLANLVVSESHRRNGIGKRMVELAQYLVAKKWQTPQANLFVMVEPTNTSAIRLYEREGFQWCDSSTRYISKYVTASCHFYVKNICTLSTTLRNMEEGEMEG